VNDVTRLFAELDTLVRKLARIGDLDEEDRQHIKALPLIMRPVLADHDILGEGARGCDYLLLVDGVACRQRVLSNGSVQILSFHLLGDILDLQMAHLDVMDHSLAAVTPCRVGVIPRVVLHDLMRQRPRVAAALWRDTLVDASIGREWLTGVGRRSAYQRIAHLLCELFVRFQAVGLAEADGFDLPLTQTQIGDALGLTAVHVNRVLQELRKHAIIASQGRFVQILDWRALQRAGDFDPAYLHLTAPSARYA
jgi:CRP-like cAMP-binding protein